MSGMTAWQTSTPATAAMLRVRIKWYPRRYGRYHDTSSLTDPAFARIGIGGNSALVITSGIMSDRAKAGYEEACIDRV